MAITLNRFSSGQTTYIEQHNSNATILENNFNQLENQLNGTIASTANAQAGFEALFGSTVAVIGIDSYDAQTSGTNVIVSSGFAWLPTTKTAVHKATSTTVAFAGQPSGTYYIILDTAGEPASSTGNFNGIWQVVWNGSSVTSLTREGQIAWGFTDFNLAKVSTTLGTSYDRLDDRLEAIEQSASSMVSKAFTSSDVTLTDVEAMENVAVRCTGTLTANVDLIVPDREKSYIIINDTSGAYTVTVKTSAGTGIATSGSSRHLLYCDATDVKQVGAVGSGGAGTFLALTDVPGTFTSHGNKVVAVNAGETALEFITNNPGAWTGLSDTPSVYTGQGLNVVRVNAGETGLEFTTASSASFIGLTDTPANFTAHAGKRVVVNAGETALEYEANDLLGLDDVDQANYTGHAYKMLSVKGDETGVEFSLNATPAAFVGLTDTPNSYSGQGLLFPRIKADESGIEFVASTGAQQWTDLADTPGTLAGSGSLVVQVKADETGLEFGSMSPSTFLSMTDTPSAYTGMAYYMLTVNSAENAIEFSAVASPTAFVGLLDTPSAYAGEGTKVVRVASDASGLEFHVPVFADASDVPSAYTGMGDRKVRVKAAEDGLEYIVDTFLSQTDTPNSFTGHGTKVVAVNAGETALEFITGGGGGSTTWVGLTDTPANFTGSGGKKVSCNSGETALEFTDDTFIAASDTPANFTGSGGYEVRVNSGETALEFVQESVVLSAAVPGKPGASAPIPMHVFAYSASFPSGLTGSQGYALTAATAQTDIDVQKNGSSVGTVRFAAAANTATFIAASPISFVAGDRLHLVAPASQDATLADVMISFKGTK